MSRFILVVASCFCLIGTAFAQVDDTASSAPSTGPVEEVPGAGDGTSEPGQESSQATKSEATVPVSSAFSEETPASSRVPVPRSSIPSSVASSEQASFVAVSSSAAISSRAGAPNPRPRFSSSISSSLESSSQSSFAISSEATVLGTGASFWDRDNFGYDMPFIDPEVLASPQTFSWGAVPTNTLLAFLFVFVIGLSGLLLFSVAPHAQTNASLSERLGTAALITILLIELFEMFVPHAFAQGIDTQATVSFLRLPSYAFLFFVVMGITDSFYGSLRSMPISAFNRWVKRVIGKEDLQRAAWFVLLLIILYGIISAYRKQEFSLLPTAQVGLIVVTILSIVIKTYSTDFFKLFVARRWKYPSWFEANVGGLIFAIVCVYITRKFELNPGFMYGLPVGLYLLLKDPHRDPYLKSLTVWWELLVAAIFWFLAPFLQSYELLYDVAIAIPFIFIEGLFFDLLPIPTFSGGTIFKWKKLLWAIQFVIVTFVLFQFIFNPTESVGGIQESPPTMFMLIGLGCYIVGIVCLWVYVRMRKAKA